MAKTTFVLSVTAAGAAAADVGAVAELDWSAAENLTEDGSVKSSFLPGEEAVFVVSCPTGWRVEEVLVHSKCGSGYIEPGTVLRSRDEQAGFDSQSPSATLGYWPHTAPEVTLYTVPETTMRYTLTGRTLTPAAGEELPVEAQIAYVAKCQQVRYTPPAGLQLATSDDKFPVRIEIVVAES
jgi:hypothetical protein